jgi:porphobilinogen synthase
MRELVQETTLSPKDFICPVFVQEDLKERVKVESMSEIERLPLSDVNEEVQKIIDLGIPAIMLFGIPAAKDEAGSSAFE